jgi:hypothetical protein
MNEEMKRKLDEALTKDRRQNRRRMGLLILVGVILATGIVFLRYNVLLRHPIQVPDSIGMGMARQGHF